MGIFFRITHVSCVIYMWHFLTVQRVGLQCVIVVFSDHNHLLLDVTTLKFVLCGYRKKFPCARI